MSPSSDILTAPKPCQLNTMPLSRFKDTTINKQKLKEKKKEI